MKTLIVYAHLLAACVAVGILLIQDVALIRSKGNPLDAHSIRELIKSAKIVSFALVALWVSGVLLTVIGYLENPQQYLSNQKLWAKFTVVAILTTNGFLLHFYSFPKVATGHGISGLNAIEQMMVMASGAVSSVSWLFACFLGVARSWNYTVDYSYIMSIYAAILVAAIIVSSELLRFLRRNEAAAMGGEIRLGPLRNSTRKIK